MDEVGTESSRHSDRHWEVFVIEYARSRDQPIGSLLAGVFDEGTIDLPFAFVLARRGDLTVLVDTGFMREGSGAEMAVRFGIADWVSPVRMLQLVGVEAASVTHIVVSHAHYDHMGAIDQFPRAHLFLQKRELLTWVEAMALPRQFGAITAVLDPEDIHDALRAAEEHRLTLLEGDRDDLLPGLHVRCAEGHTLGQQYVALETARGRFVVSGDCIYSSRNLTGRGGDGIYIPLGSGIGSVWEQLKSMDRMNQEVGGDIGRVLILHDFERWSRFEVSAELGGFRVFRVA
ncbi:MAG: N-acyl homoserine lactonase family protein [Acetobacteraceae bacterium]|nr:N-acyl homoserine lactonase family protein [Acetobacteraceae bacterium]